MMDELKIDDKSYDYLDLSKKYSQFTSPNIRIFIDSINITEKIKISEIEVENSVYKAGCFTFKAVNAYDKKKKDFLFDEQMSVGLTIKIDFGYKNIFTTVFIGIITSVSYSISTDEGAVVIVSGLDKSFLLMKGRKSAIWQDKTHSEIVKNISNRYKLKTNVGDTSFKYETVVQNQLSDYEFITYLTNVNSYEFFILGSNLYFREINKDKSSAITFTMFETILNANIGKDIGDLIGAAAVRGYNLKKEETEVVVKNVSSVNQNGKTGISVLNSLDDKNLVHYIYEPNIEKKEAEKLAKSYLEKVAMSYVFGDIKTIGIPDIKAGRYITIKGLNGENSRQIVYARSIRHTMDEDGYTTYIEIGGNSL